MKFKIVFTTQETITKGGGNEEKSWEEWVSFYFKIIPALLGVYMTSETLNSYKCTTPSVTKNFKVNVFLKKCLGSIFC
jgi:hypothetical protein